MTENPEREVNGGQPMSPLVLSLAAVGVLGMWIVVLGHICLGTACTYALCCRSCVGAVNRFARCFGYTGKENSEWQARVLCAFVGCASTDVGVKGIRYMLETTGYIFYLFNVR